VTKQHPITPSPELLNQWSMDFYELGEWRAIAILAAQWGADQELEACCKIMQEWPSITVENGYALADELIRAARRPRPPSLKEEALEELAEWENVMDIAPDSPIRRALEALPND